MKVKDRYRQHHEEDEGVVDEFALLRSSVAENAQRQEEKFGNYC
jgi:hypothetical protein